jgi:hypothetical protein
MVLLPWLAVIWPTTGHPRSRQRETPTTEVPSQLSLAGTRNAMTDEIVYQTPD